MKKLVVLGSTGATGQPLVKQAVDRGHEVVAVLRDPAKLTSVEDPEAKVTKVTPSIFSADQLKPHFKGADVVISTLGFSPFGGPVIGYIEATKAMLGALKDLDVEDRPKRLVLMHSWYTSPESREQASWWKRWLLIPMIRPVLDNMWEAEQFLQKEIGDTIKYTVVLPPGLASGEVTTSEFKAVENVYEIPDAVGRINRADVARFILDLLDQEKKYVNAKVSIAV